MLLSSGPVLLARDLGPNFRSPAHGGSPSDDPEEGLDEDALSGIANLATMVEDGILPLRKALEEPERKIIRWALELNGGSRKKTAKMLEINRTTLFNKMKKYNLMEFSPEGG